MDAYSCTVYSMNMYLQFMVFTWLYVYVPAEYCMHDIDWSLWIWYEYMMKSAVSKVCMHMCARTAVCVGVPVFVDIWYMCINMCILWYVVCIYADINIYIYINIYLYTYTYQYLYAPYHAMPCHAKPSHTIHGGMYTGYIYVRLSAFRLPCKTLDDKE